MLWECFDCNGLAALVSGRDVFFLQGTYLCCLIIINENKDFFIFMNFITITCQLNLRKDELWICWCSQNAIELEEKEKREKEMRNQIIIEAEEYIQAFYEKRKLNVETNKASNREREKVKCWKANISTLFSFLLRHGLLNAWICAVILG